jgi:glyoxylase-like metal-dependent hydrolase (beta-lactamase superfamily II)
MMRTSLKLLSDGTIRVDGGVLFGQVPKIVWKERVSVDRDNRIPLGLNCLLVQINGKNILVDTGVGGKEPEDIREVYGLTSGRLCKYLKELGVTPGDIDLVILTHLRFDHSGGCTRLDRMGSIVTTFPRAKYYVQRSCWEEANTPSERGKEFYHPDDFKPLLEQDRLILLDGDTEIMPGVRTRVTNGPTRGHQIVLVNCGAERVAFTGDLIPTHHHIDPLFISASDQFPEETLRWKREVLCQAEKEGWLLVFSHGYEVRAAYLERRNGKPQLRPVEL